MVPVTTETVGRCAEEDGIEKVGVSKDLDGRGWVKMQRVGHMESKGRESRNISKKLRGWYRMRFIG